MMKTNFKRETVWKKILLSPSNNLKTVLKNLNDNNIGIVLIVDKNKHLLGTVTDGDIRRALVAGKSLHSSIKDIYHKNPLIADIKMEKTAIKNLMKMNHLGHIPIVNNKKQVIGLYTFSDLDNFPKSDNFFVIMAGGKGKRMMPLTKNIPKPLLNLNGKPIIQHIIERARDNGFGKFIITLNYLGKLIKDYLKTGKELGVDIEYIFEKRALGTAGSLGLIKSKIKKTFLVSNGDVITEIDYNKFLSFHKLNNSLATMAVKSYESKNPYGLIKADKMKIVGFDEKPIRKDYINAGIYVLEPQAIKSISGKKMIDMPNLFKELKNRKDNLYVFPIHETWIDLGSKKNYKKINYFKRKK